VGATRLGGLWALKWAWIGQSIGIGETSIGETNTFRYNFLSSWKLWASQACAVCGRDKLYMGVRVDAANFSWVNR